MVITWRSKGEGNKITLRPDQRTNYESTDVTKLCSPHLFWSICKSLRVEILSFKILSFECLQESEYEI